MSEVIFRRDGPRLGRFELRPVAPAEDARLLYAWVTDAKFVFWLMQDADIATVEREYVQIATSGHRDAYLGFHDGKPAFLVEKYDPARSELADHYRVEAGDVGMHFLTAPTDAPVHGFTRAVLVTVMEFLFADQATRRVVVEPDVRNTAVRWLNAEVGFRIEHEVVLAAKMAHLSTCTRELYR